MQDFTTDYNGDNISSTIFLKYKFSKSTAEDTQCIWALESVWKGRYLPLCFQDYECDRALPSINWEVIEDGSRIPFGKLDIEKRKALKAVFHDLASRIEIAVAEINEFHQGRIEELIEKLDYFQQLKNNEIKGLEEFNKAWGTES
jgi:hypothetical protein